VFSDIGEVMGADHEGHEAVTSLCCSHGGTGSEVVPYEPEKNGHAEWEEYFLSAIERFFYL
jgi:hypothetical protein